MWVQSGESPPPPLLLFEDEAIETEFDMSFLEMTGANAAVIHEIAISEIKSSIKEKAKLCFFGFDFIV